MRRKLIAGNWKMHGGLASNEALLCGVLAGLPPRGGVDVAVCVPFPYLSQVQLVLMGTSLAWGAQTISEFDRGAYTGEVSGAMLREFGVRYVVVGHSERRALYGETNQVVAAKFAAALRAGLTPILCVGETLAERQAGVTDQVVAAQLDAVLDLCGVDEVAKSVLAYEPVWAIGTGLTASPVQAQEVHGLLRGKLAALSVEVANSIQILYGGSVKPGNAKELFAQPDIDGGLIGGASLQAEDFLGIVRAAA